MKQNFIKNILTSKSKYFSVLCFVFLIGVSSASLGGIKIPVEWTVILLGIWCVPMLLSEKIKKQWSASYFWSLKIIGIVVALVAGIIRFTIVFPEVTIARVEYFVDKKVEISGMVTTEPDVRLDSVRYVVKVATVTVAGKTYVVNGYVYFKSDRYPQYAYGDQLKIGCALVKPEPIIDESTGQIFRYDYYLALHNAFAVCNRPHIERISSGKGNYLFSIILKAKRAVATQITRLWPEPEASFMAGLLYGYRGGLGELTELFSRTGVTHIVAVSGFNISIIATILLTLTTSARVRRQHAFWLVSIGIIGFVIFTGASASVVRAGVMGIITLLAKQVGRVSHIGNVLLVAAVLMVLHQPLVLWFDAGFQLSFLSTLGLVYVAPLGTAFERYLPTKLGLRETIIATISATIATLPLILYQFGRFSVVAIIVNVLILWLISWLMLAGTVAVVIGAFIPSLAVVSAWPAHLGMSYTIHVVSWFARLPMASVDVRVSVAVAAGMCGLLLTTVIYHQKLNDKK